MNLLFIFLLNFAFPSETFPSQPKLLLVLVIDQLRSDFLTQNKEEFLPVSEKGFRFLMEEGSYAPFATYPSLQNLTCSGHAMIATGATPSRTKIILNEWWDKKTEKNIYCTEDAQFGSSPVCLKSPTLWDEMKLSYPETRVISLSLKDRSAIILGGKGADLAVWLSAQTLKWETSDYYPMAQTWRDLRFNSENKTELLTWKSQIPGLSFEKKERWGSSKSFAFPSTVEQTFEVSNFLIDQFKLGSKKNPDVLLISLSTHDLAGHIFGPHSPEMHDLTLKEDRSISIFLKKLMSQFKNPKEDLWIVLTADHGVAPLNEGPQKIKIHGGSLSVNGLTKKLNEYLKEQKISSCGGKPWVEKLISFHVYYNKNCDQKSPAEIAKVSSLLSDFLKTLPGIEDVINGVQVQKNIFPWHYEKQIKASYVPGLSGDLVILPQPYWVSEDSANARHVTSFSYDRTVPVILWGQPFKKSLIKKPTSVLDIVDTLSFALGLVPPAHSEGQVIEDALY